MKSSTTLSVAIAAIVIGSPLLTGGCTTTGGNRTATSRESQAPDLIKPPPLGVDELREIGDQAVERGDPYAALDAYRRAEEKAPNDPGLQYRIAVAAADAQQGDVGLAAIDRLTELSPDAREDAEVADLRKRLQSMPQKGPKRRAQLDAIAEILFDYRRVDHAPTKSHLAKQARTLLSPLISEGTDNFEVWRLAGYIAVARQNDNLAAFAFEAINRLRPHYREDPHLNRLMRQLARMPIAQRVRDIPVAKRYHDSPFIHDPRLYLEGHVVPADSINFIEKLKTEIKEYQEAARERGPFDDQVILFYVVDAILAAETLAEVHAYGLLGQEPDDEKAQHYFRVAKRIFDRYKSEFIANGSITTEFTTYGDVMSRPAFQAALIAERLEAGSMSSLHGVELEKIDDNIDVAVRRDLSRAIKWQREAVSLAPEHAGSRKMLAQYLSDAGREQEAYAEYLRAAELGDTMAMYNVGVYHWNGDYARKDEAAAVRWWRRAANAGYDNAIAILRQHGYSW